jgi:ribonuclease P protein component
MLSQNNRLNKGFFPNIYRGGEKKQGYHIQIIKKKGEKDELRFGFVVAKKKVKLANQRNRLKRIMRAEVESSISSLNSGYCLLLTFIGKRALLKEKNSSQIIRDEIRLLFNKLNLFKK